MHPDRPLVMFAVVLIALVSCGGDDVAGDGGAAPTTPTEPTTSTSTTSTSSTTTTAPPTTTTTAPPTTTTTEPPTTTTTEPPTTTTTEPPTPPLLEQGDRGAGVEEVQRRLETLRYWVGPTDGIFGRLTEQAVYAFQKVNGITVDGVVGPETRATLDEPRQIYAPQTSTGSVIEVDKGTQVLVHVVDGNVDWIWNTATGTENPYTYNGEQYIADTPPGRHSIYRQIDGIREAALGNLYRPKYFHRDGIAIHGYADVPPVPASHGCVRLTTAAMDHLWATGIAPVGSAVLVHGTTPPTSEPGSGPFAG